MPEKLRRRYVQIAKSLDDARSYQIWFYWNLGELLREVADNSSEYVGTDGTPGVELLGRALQLHDRTLRRAMQFARSFTRTEVEYIVSLQNDEGYKINWGHISYLLTLNDEEDRTRFAELAVKESLSPEALHSEIKRYRDPEQAGNASRKGRPHEKPKTPEACIRQMVKLTQTWVEKYHMVWGSEDGGLADVDAAIRNADLSDNSLEQLRYLRQLLAEMSNTAASAIDVVDGMLKHAQVTAE